MSEQIINSEQALESQIANMRAQYAKHKYLRVDVKTGKQRTSTQNRALHKWCAMVAVALNDAGYDFRTFIKEGYPVPFNESLVKEHLWRPVQKVMTGKDSTTKPETHEYAEIYDVLNAKLAEHSVYVPWPSVETMRA